MYNYQLLPTFFEDFTFEVLSKKNIVRSVHIGYNREATHQTFGLELIRVYAYVEIDEAYQAIQNLNDEEWLTQHSYNRSLVNKSLSSNVSILINSNRNHHLKHSIKENKLKNLKIFYDQYETHTRFLYRFFNRHFSEDSISIQTPKSDLEYWLIRDYWNEAEFNDKAYSFFKNYRFQDLVNICHKYLLRDQHITKHRDIPLEGQYYVISVLDIIENTYSDIYSVIDFLTSYEIPIKVSVEENKLDVKAHLIHLCQMLEQLSTLEIGSKFQFDISRAIQYIKKAIDQKFTKQQLNQANKSYQKIESLEKFINSFAVSNNSLLGKVTHFTLDGDFSLLVHYIVLKSNLKIGQKSMCIEYDEITGFVDYSSVDCTIRNSGLKTSSQLARYFKSKSNSIEIIKP